MLFTADDEAAIWVNGTLVADSKSVARRRQRRLAPRPDADVTSHLHSGANTIAVQVKNRLDAGNNPTPEGFIARLKADTTTLSTRAAPGSPARPTPTGWEQPAFDDTAWTPARELATYGSGPWGANVSLPPQPSPYLRKDFTADQADRRSPPVRLRARRLRGPHQRPEGRRRRSSRPGWTEYSKRVPSQTYDVTGLVKQGDNAIGAILGDGWYSTPPAGRQEVGHAPRAARPAEDHLHRRHARPASPPTTRGRSAQRRPARHRHLRRRDLRRPPRPAPAGTSPASTAAGAARSSATRRWRWSRARRRRSRSSTRSQPKTRHASPSPAPTIYDLGQNFAGWARIKATGAAGTQIRLRFGEILNGDGTLYTANLRSAQQTDTLTLAGRRHRRPTSRASPTTASATSR